MNEFTAWHAANRLKPVATIQPASAGLHIPGGEFIRCPAARTARVRTLAPASPAMNEFTAWYPQTG